MFAFQGELSHDYASKISVAENDLVEWLEWFQKSGYLNNTMLVFMSDHGQRYNKKIYWTIDFARFSTLFVVHPQVRIRARHTTRQTRRTDAIFLVCATQMVRPKVPDNGIQPEQQH